MEEVSDDETEYGEFKRLVRHHPLPLNVALPPLLLSSSSSSSRSFRTFILRTPTLQCLRYVTSPHLTLLYTQIICSRPLIPLSLVSIAL